MQKLYFYLILVSIFSSVNAQTVWNGPNLTFTQTSGGGGSPDQITNNVWLTRGSTGGLYNSKTETGYSNNVSPAGTEWAYGLLANYATLTYTPWQTWHGKNPPSSVQKDAVLHLIAENIYIGIKFLSWDNGKQGGDGGFSYQRSTSSTLPVSLKSFTATLSGNNAVVGWTTASEINNRFFEVQHSLDGSVFSAVGRVQGSGSSTTDHSYLFTHQNISGGKHFYRLAQYDVDGAVKYSSIVQLTSLTNIALQVAPNPATSIASIRSSSDLSGSLYTISSAAGQIIKSGVIDGRPIQVQKLSAGSYWLIVKTADGKSIQTQLLKL